MQEAYGPSYKVVGVKSREVLLNAGMLLNAGISVC